MGDMILLQEPLFLHDLFRSNRLFRFSFTDGGLWEYECSYTLVNNSGVTIFSGNHLTVDQTIGDCAVEAVQILRLVILTLMLKKMMVVVLLTFNS